MTRKKQFPPMTPKRVDEVDKTLTGLTALGMDTQLYDELHAEVRRAQTLLTLPAIAEVLARADLSIAYKLRFNGGIGTDGTRGCFVCGGSRYQREDGHQRNIAGFVESNAEGFLAETWRLCGIRLDHRGFEPDWRQLKIGTCDAHTKQLQCLIGKIVAAGGRISRQMVEEAATWFPEIDPDTAVARTKAIGQQLDDLAFDALRRLRTDNVTVTLGTPIPFEGFEKMRFDALTLELAALGFEARYKHLEETWDIVPKAPGAVTKAEKA